MANEEKYIVPVIGGIAAFMVLNKILMALGLSKGANQQAVDNARDAALAKALADAQKKQASTKTDAEWSAIADTIYTDLRYSSLDDNKADAGYQLSRVKNDTDVFKLISFFGTRTEYLFGLPTMEGGLPEFVRSNLSTGDIDIINDNYRRKGISFRW
jgi:hypothetical protein